MAEPILSLVDVHAGYDGVMLMGAFAAFYVVFNTGDLWLGVGAALAIGGALLGTLIPQVVASGDVPRYAADYGPALGLLSGIIVVVGTIGVVLHLSFGRGREGRLAAVRDALVRSWGGLGRWFILVAFAAILATTFLSRLSLLVGRVQFLLDSVQGLLGGQG